MFSLFFFTFPFFISFCPLTFVSFYLFMDFCLFLCRIEHYFAILWFLIFSLSFITFVHLLFFARQPVSAVGDCVTRSPDSVSVHRRRSDQPARSVRIRLLTFILCWAARAVSVLQMASETEPDQNVNPSLDSASEWKTVRWSCLHTLVPFQIQCLFSGCLIVIAQEMKWDDWCVVLMLM